MTAIAVVVIGVEMVCEGRELL